MKRISLVTPKFLKPIPGHQVSARQKKAIRDFVTKESPAGYNVSSTLEELLLKLNSIKSYDEIPDQIRISYTDLLSRNIDLKDTFDVVRLTARLAASKFNEKPKEIFFTGFSGYFKLDSKECKKLISAGFVGCGLSPMVYGIEAAMEYSYLAEKDPSYWSPLATAGEMIITKPQPLEITLTFRQEQVLMMILKGMTNYQIAKRLDLSESTVKMHIGIVLKKYQVQHRTQLILSHGMINKF